MLIKAATVLMLVAAALPASVTGATYSTLWGIDGDEWSPAGRLPDFSYAGYKQGNEPLPSPPVTRSVVSFKESGMSDTQMLKAALDWANKQPLTDEFIVLSIPAGKYTLTERLYIRRSRVVLRGDGVHATVLYMPKSLTGVYGKNSENGSGGWVNSDAFLTIEGPSIIGDELATVTESARKGSVEVQVDSASKLEVGQYYDTWWTDKDGKFNDHMFDNLWEAPPKYAGSTRVQFTTKILSVCGNLVKLERHLPYDIDSTINTVRFHALPDTVTESGVEGMAFDFEWSWYAGHHLEEGYNALELRNVRDCFIRDVATVNADNSVLMSGISSTTVSNVAISVSETRANDFPNEYNERADRDGHWGVHFARSFDVMVQNVTVECHLLHTVGTDSSSKWGVFMNLKFDDGNMDLHRALAGPTLYTNNDAGLGTYALASGGPKSSGPNALAGTTWWNIKSAEPVSPSYSNKNRGECAFGPVINLVGVDLIPSEAQEMCKTWLYERNVTSPSNLYQAQYERRMRLAASSSQQAGGCLGSQEPLL